MEKSRSDNCANEELAFTDESHIRDDQKNIIFQAELNEEPPFCLGELDIALSNGRES